MPCVSTTAGSRPPHRRGHRWASKPNVEPVTAAPGSCPCRDGELCTSAEPPRSSWGHAGTTAFARSLLSRPLLVSAAVRAPICRSASGPTGHRRPAPELLASSARGMLWTLSHQGRRTTAACCPLISGWSFGPLNVPARRKLVRHAAIKTTLAAPPWRPRSSIPQRRDSGSSGPYAP